MNEKKWWKPLLLIPAALAVDFLAFLAAVLLDDRIAENASGQGHPAPAFTVIALLILGIATILLVLTVLIVCLKRLIRRNAAEEGAGNAAASAVAVPGEAAKPLKKPKDPDRFLLLIPAQLVISVLLLVAVFKAEMDAYEPVQPGFPVPIGTIMLFFVLLAVTILVIILAFILRKHALKKWKKWEEENKTTD